MPVSVHTINTPEFLGNAKLARSPPLHPITTSEDQSSSRLAALSHMGYWSEEIKVNSVVLYMK